MASKRRNMFHKNKTQETTEKAMLAVLAWWLAVVIGGMWLMTRPHYWWWRGVSQGGGVPVPLLGTCWPPSRLSRGISGLLHFLYSTRGGRPYLGFHLLTRPCLMLSDPRLINEMFVKNFDTFKSRANHVNLKHDFMARNVIHLEGEQWRVVRTKMTPYFTPARIKGSLGLAAASLELVKARLGTGGVVDVHSLMIRYTTDVLTAAVFGVKSDAFDAQQSFFCDLQRSMFDPRLTIRILLSMVSPRLYDLFGSCLLTREATSDMKDLTFRIIEERMQTEEKRNDFVQAMIELKEKDENTEEEKILSDGLENLKFDMLTITAQLMALYTAGTESSGLTLAFALYELAVDPAVQQKAREEVRAVIDQSPTAQLDYDTIQEMKYINNVVSETLRKYPVFSFISRKGRKPFRIPGTDTVIEMGTPVFVPVHAIHHDPRYYPDPERFDPDRFTAEEVAKRPPEAYLPFGIGPRMCLGMKFALIEVSLGLCSLLSCYKFSISPGRTMMPMELKASSFITTPEREIWLDVQPLSSEDN